MENSRHFGKAKTSSKAGTMGTRGHKEAKVGAKNKHSNWNLWRSLRELPRARELRNLWLRGWSLGGHSLEQ